MLKCLNAKITRGFTLIDVLIGVFLILIVFLGIFGAYQLGLKVVSQSKNRIVATALANQIIEQTQNLPYDKVGINRVGASPFGELEETEIVSLNNIDYTVEIGVDYVADSADGLVGPGDSCIYDYKRVRVTVFWSGNYTGEVSLATDIVPKNEVQECEETGGILWVHVFDTQGIKIEGALVQAENIITGIIKQCTSSLNDECYIPLDASPGGDPDNYKITVTKTGYSAEQTFKSGDTYGSEVIANPEKLNATILEGQVTEMSFSIDKVSAFLVETKSSRGKISFDDDFNNTSKISAYHNISVSGGEVNLVKTDGDYAASGYLISTDVSSPNLKGWNQLTWVDSSPSNTTIIYQILYFNGSNWILVPDTDLPGNSTGLGSSPVDLFVLDIAVYNQLQIKA
ncbi:hypothetical protein KKB68_00620, partial [Patescibacteria group bacterium]|nr:hypothetical protein [Patescibacteria group bacterium]